MTIAPADISLLIPKDQKSILSLEEYRSRGGFQGLQRARSMSNEAVIAEVKLSGIRGRGGAGFPAGVKWQGVSADPCETKYVVCNSAEGEPGTYKDRYLIQKNPYQLLEGLLIAAYAIQARQAFIGIKKKFTREVQRLKDALREVEQAGLVEEGFVEIVLGPDEYLLGEEKALLEVIDGRGAMPRILPPYMQGVRSNPTSYNPTVVNNVETMSHVAYILANGAEWFRSIGTQDSPGTMIFTLSGDVQRPGVYELPMGTTLRYLLEDIGGGPARDYPLKAVFSGVANQVITPDQFDTPMDFGSLKAVGSGLGSAGFIVYDESACMVKVALMFSQFLALESCGQCIPCNMGCRTITNHLDRFEKDQGAEEDVQNILLECGRVTNQTRCYLPAEEANLIASIIRKFPKEFLAHFEHSCPSTRQLPFPQIKDFDEQTKTFSYYLYPPVA